MKRKEQASRAVERAQQGEKLKFWSRLRVQMTISYAVVSVVSALLVELLLVLLFFFVIMRLPFVDKGTMDTANGAAQYYALEAAVQANGNGLNPASTFQSGQPTSLTLPPGVIAHNAKTDLVALLITPSGQILASSDTAHYPVATSLARLLPEQARMIRTALSGKADSKVDVTSPEHIVSVAQPVLNGKKQTIGAVFVQSLPQTMGGGVYSVAGGLLFTAVFWLLLTAPIGAVFGALSTRGLVKRLQRLVKATGQFAVGDYAQRVLVGRKDEIGQLEAQFNTMAQHLVESIEQQARLEERARLEQELRTAQFIQRALLPREVPSLPSWQLKPFYRPAREVGGDFYDFLPFEDGRLGIVIGDAADKGVSAALLMVTACTMLRTAALGSDSPGEVLARVNDLLAASIPPGTFVTCFYALLDPASGSLHFANAGHDLPFCRHPSGVAAASPHVSCLSSMWQPGQYLHLAFAAHAGQRLGSLAALLQSLLSVERSLFHPCLNRSFGEHGEEAKQAPGEVSRPVAGNLPTYLPMQPAQKKPLTPLHDLCILNSMVNDSPEQLTTVFFALADPTRRAILARLARGEASGTDLARPFSISVPAISKHLRVLEHADLIVHRKDGRTHRFRLTARPLKEAAAWLEHYRQFWEAQLDSLDTYLQATSEEEEQDLHDSSSIS